MRSLAARFGGVSHSELRRHLVNHLGRTVAQSLELSAMLSAQTLASELNKWSDETWALLERAKNANSLAIQLGAIRAGVMTVETFSKIAALSDLERRIDALESAQEGAAE